MKPNTICSTPDCNVPVYKKPSDKRKFCSQECRESTYTTKNLICKNCSESFKGFRSDQKYCSRMCSNIGRKGISYKIGRPACKVTSKEVLRNILIELFGEECLECGQGPLWNGKPLVLHVDHINGINDDDRIENLRFLCPNCHTQTDTYAGRNIGKSRSLFNSAEE